VCVACFSAWMARAYLVVRARLFDGQRTPFVEIFESSQCHCCNETMCVANNCLDRHQ
jgi:hypothetical protein